MTTIPFAKTTRRTSVAQAFTRKVEAKSTKGAQDWVARIQDAVPSAELVPVLAAAAVMVLTLGQLF